MNRENLQILRYSQATKIKLDKNGRAVGVWYIRHGIKKFARASKEIIISGKILLIMSNKSGNALLITLFVMMF